jgi:cobalt-zinc-cadmium efflux system outer membrane protein
LGEHASSGRGGVPLGIAQADLVQAGLLRNPVFSGRVRFPDRPPSGTNLELAVVQDFLDVLTLSARKSLAAGQLEAVELEVALDVLDLAAQVREASIAALGAKQMAAMRKLVVDAAQASAEFARRLHEAGNISDLQLAGELGLYESARVAWARADAERLVAREELSGMMGLWGENLSWTLPDSLPEIPAEEVDLQQLESVAVAGRLDLLLARKESDLIAGALGLTRDWRFLALAEVGVSTERDSDGQWLTGPELSLELPIFDQGQARTARLVAQLRQADQRVFALAVEIRSEVRVLRERLLALRRLTEHYRTVVIPLRESIVAFTKQEFDFNGKVFPAIDHLVVKTGEKCACGWGT